MINQIISLDAGAFMDFERFFFKSNLSVGLPFDIVLYEKEAFEIHKRARVEADDLVYHQISSGWGDALKEAFVSSTLR